MGEVDIMQDNAKYIDRNGELHDLPDGEQAIEKASVYGYCQQGDYILMCRDRGDKYWTLPGGTQDPGESDRATLLRESLEEVGLQLDISDQQPIHTHHELFHDNLKGGYYRSTRRIYKAMPSTNTYDTHRVFNDEIAAFGWFHIRELEDLPVESFHKDALTQIS